VNKLPPGSSIRPQGQGQRASIISTNTNTKDWKDKGGYREGRRSKEEGAIKLAFTKQYTI
jgi:hypothetical protein